MTELYPYTGAIKRKFRFTCPECDTVNVRWVNKKPETELEKLASMVIVSCYCCEASFKISPEEESDEGSKARDKTP